MSINGVVVNLNQLRYLSAVAETSSFSVAAEKCCVTQPTLSNGIAQLEKHLGGKLFKRTTRSVVLTKFGAFILPLAQGVLEAKDELEQCAQTFYEPQARILRIGMSPLIDSPLLSKALDSFQGREEWSEVFLKQCFLDDLVDRLENQTLDLALLPKGSKQHKHETSVLYEEELFYLPPGSDLSPSPMSNAIEVDRLRDQPIILTQGCGLSDVIASLFEEANVPLTPYPGQALSYAVVEEWADLGIAGGILPRSKLSPDATNAQPILSHNSMVATVAYEAIWVGEEADVQGVEKCAHHLSMMMGSLSEGLAQ